jgi:CDP-glycerol glycerophosphotransferase
MISIFIPKSTKIFLVGGWFGQRFADNSKYFFLYSHKNKNKLGIDRVIWITRNPEVKKELQENGFEAYMAWSLKSIWYHFRAGIHVIDQCPFDINHFFSVRSKRINLWHGFPLKKVGSFMKPYTESKWQKKHYLQIFLSLFSSGCWGNFFVLGTSEFAAEIQGQVFNVPKERRLISCYPRNYEAVLERPIKYTSRIEEPFLQKIEQAKKNGSRIIAYLPTFRDKAKTLMFGTHQPEEIRSIIDFFEIKNIVIVAKFHFAENGGIFGNLAQHELFLNLPSAADVYTFISEFDLLITDYSSIYYDFLLWSKPIVFFPYDLEYYRDHDRGLIFDYDEYTPGPKVFNIDELKELLSHDFEAIEKQYKAQYGKAAFDLKKKIFGDVENMQIDHLIKQIREN